VTPVVLNVVTTVSEELIISIFRAEVKLRKCLYKERVTSRDCERESVKE
jgi:hypothetical protein